MSPRTPWTLKQLLEWSGGRIVNGARTAPDVVGLDRLADLRDVADDTGRGAVSFFFASKYRDALARARPSVLITGDAFVSALEASRVPVWTHSVVVSTADPYQAMARVSQGLAQYWGSPAGEFALESRDTPRATEIHPTAKLGPGVIVAPGVRVGARSVLHAHVVISEDCVIGEDCVLYPNVVLYSRTQIGNRVRVHANTTVGSDGFGYAPERRADGSVIHHKIEHWGGVWIGDDVEIGANSSIDRGTLQDTRIERGAKLDNQVQVGHNSVIGEGAVICGAVGLAGNSQVGRYAYLGGGSGVGNHSRLGDRSRIAAYTVVSKDIPADSEWAGYPMRPVREFRRAHALVNRLLKRQNSEGEIK